VVSRHTAKYVLKNEFHLIDAIKKIKVVDAIVEVLHLEMQPQNMEELGR
jgi:hypothetical protein